jgi:hypothetical protein
VDAPYAFLFRLERLDLSRRVHDNGAPPQSTAPAGAEAAGLVFDKNDDSG